MFHPEGLVFGGRCEVLGTGRLGALGERLAGPVLARCSQALWRRETEHLDVLGIALRFHPGLPEAQDLLLATIRSPLTMPLAPLATDTGDFFGNDYFAVSPFDAGPAGRVKLRLRPLHSTPPGGSRRERLLAAVAAGHARWRLDARRTLSLRWRPVARITLDEPVDVDQEALRFDPFRAGAGLVPVGFVHAIRRVAYPASQRARPAQEA